MSDLDNLLADAVGKPLSKGGPSVAPDPVNLPMIRHWVDAFDDQNPIHLDDDAAIEAGFDGLVAPPAMLQTWTMGRPTIAGIAERGGSAGDMDPDSPLQRLAAAGFTGTLATNSELEFHRYLRLGEQLESATLLDEVSEPKTTGLGAGYFVTWVTNYTSAGELVGRQRFRVLKFDPTTAGQAAPSGATSRAPKEAPTVLEVLPDFSLDVTSTVIVAGAIASRDYMPVHHDRDYAQAQGAPDIFMNILSTNGYVSRYVTDWAGPAARLDKIAIRLGGPAIPGQPLRFSGEVIRRDDGASNVDVALRAVNDLGMHVSGVVTLTLD